MCYRNIKRVFLSLFVAIPLCGMTMDIAITIDDYPMGNSRLFSAKQRTPKFLSACSKYNCKVAFFCIGQHCKRDGAEALLMDIDKEGHFLANHSMSHGHFSSQTLNDFSTEIQSLEVILSPYKNMRKWFRYPFLDYGNQAHLGGCEAKTSQSIDALKGLGYSDGYVTINTFDWYINGKLNEALEKGRSVDYKALKGVYLGLLQEWCDFYIEFYKKEFSENITHTLLLHASDLNALYLQDILAMIKKNGWNIVSPELAFANTSWRDKIYKGTGPLIGKPPSMDGSKIDERLQAKKCFK